MSRAHIFVCDLCMVALATFTALILRDNFETSEDHLSALFPYLVISVCVACAVFPAFGTYRALWRFATPGDVLLVVSASLAMAFGAVAVGFSYNRSRACRARCRSCRRCSSSPFSAARG